MNTLTVTSNVKGIIKQLHFNLWDSARNELHFLDIGILCKNDKCNLTIHLPDCGQKLELEDLSSKFIDNIPNAIFNTPVDSEEKNRIRIFKIENNLRFILSPFDTNVSVNPNKIGEINIAVEKQQIPPNVPAVDHRYYRFRIKNFDLTKVIIEVDSNSKSFESSFSSCKVIDFRVNDSKLLPVIESQKIISSADVFEKIHFLYMTDVNEDIQLTGGNYTTRFLERDIWNDYLNLGKKERFDMIAYHLRQEKSFSANFLIKCTYSKTSKWHLVAYAGIVIALAIVANFLCWLFPRLLFPRWLFPLLKNIFIKG